MMEFFSTKNSVSKEFEICIGRPKIQTPHWQCQWITMKGESIHKELEEISQCGKYEEKTKKLLNGIRECYINETKVKR